MKLQFLGSGNAFTAMCDNFQSNMVLETDTGSRLLIDCGSDVRHSLKKVNLTSKDLEAVYISHLHSDHIGGMEWLAFTRKFDPTTPKPKLILQPSIIKPLWEHTLSGGLQSIESEQCSLETYFDIYPLEDEHHFIWQSIPFEMVQTIHTYNNKELNPSYGLFFTINKTNIFITTDTQFTPDKHMEYYKKAHIIFHDCETTSYKTGVHSHLEDLATLPEDIKSKMWLYHYSSLNIPTPEKYGFQGVVKRGQVFNY